MTNSPTILIVDDEPPIRKLLRMGLTTQGYQVLEEANGKSALEQLIEKPALVVLDLGLPDIDGLELLRRIRHRHSDLPVIVLSSRGDEAGKVAALDRMRKRCRTNVGRADIVWNIRQLVHENRNLTQHLHVWNHLHAELQL